MSKYTSCIPSVIECQQDTVCRNNDRRFVLQSQSKSSLLSSLQHASPLKLQRITPTNYRPTQDLAIEMCKEMDETETGWMSRTHAVLKLKSMGLAPPHRLEWCRPEGKRWSSPATDGPSKKRYAKGRWRAAGKEWWAYSCAFTTNSSFAWRRHIEPESSGPHKPEMKNWCASGNVTHEALTLLPALPAVRSVKKMVSSVPLQKVTDCGLMSESLSLCCSWKGKDDDDNEASPRRHAKWQWAPFPSHSKGWTASLS